MTSSNLSPLKIESEAYKNFINSLDSEATKKSYRYCLSFFMGYCNLDDYDYDGLLRLSQALNKLEDKIRDYITYLKINKKLSSNTVNLYIAALAHFYAMNNIVLNWRRLSKFKGKKRLVVEDKPYLKEQIRQLLDFSDLRCLPYQRHRGSYPERYRIQPRSNKRLLPEINGNRSSFWIICLWNCDNAAS